MTGLPGVCRDCGQSIVWKDRAWRERTFRDRGTGPQHACPPPRGECGAWMPLAQERCARWPGHVTEHRTRYALDNSSSLRMVRQVAS